MCGHSQDWSECVKKYVKLSFWFFYRSEGPDIIEIRPNRTTANATTAASTSAEQNPRQAETAATRQVQFLI